MEQESATAPPLERSTSQLSNTSASYRSATATRTRSRRLASRVSSSASSTATSDKSLTSFPSFSPESSLRQVSASHPKSDSISTACPSVSQEPLGPIGTQNDTDISSTPFTPAATRRIVDTLTDISPEATTRTALFEDTPFLSSRNIPGTLHQANNAHIERLVARHGAVSLIRQIAEDLAYRDAQIAVLRRKAENRERALRKIILECGFSNLEVETRLRAIENDPKATNSYAQEGHDGISNLMSDAMSETVLDSVIALGHSENATIKASTTLRNPGMPKGTTKGWKDYIWGGATSKKDHPGSSIQDNITKLPAGPVRTHGSGERRPGLTDDFFSLPDTSLPRSPSRASSTRSVPQGHKTSLAGLALRLVAGSASTTRDSDSIRGRAPSVGQPASIRTSSTASAHTTASTRVTTGGGPKSLMGLKRSPGTSSNPATAAIRSQTPLERRDAGSDSPKPQVGGQENFGPVEMDTILPPDTQPPTLSNLYYIRSGSGFLTDRFGFIYDKRRKKRQREASELARHIKSHSRAELLSNGRNGFPPTSSYEGRLQEPSDEQDSSRPASPGQMDQLDKPKRWQDYLRIATFPTELLSHTPSIDASIIKVVEDGRETKLPGMPTSQERGFLPHASTTTSVNENDSVPQEENESASAMLVKEDTEPVKLLLKQLSEVHDMLQKEKTVRWNDFLRKVRAERRREGEAAAASGLGTAAMPETKLTDGEMIGVAGLGNKGKIGRAKWNEFKMLVLGGIPVAYRSKIWSECCGATVLRVPGYYDDLISRNMAEDDQVVASQIEMDITRTLTDNIFFRQGPGVAKLKEVLLAYARRNVEVGYCQGMNLIAANLLLITPSAEDAFWILTSIIEHILPTGYYDHSLLASRADQRVLRQYVSNVLPKLSAHLMELGVELEALTFQWFLSVFTDCLSAEALFRVWDVVLCTHDGSTFLFQVALALLKLNEAQLLLCNTTSSVYTYINHQMTNHAISIDGLIHASEGLRKLVKRKEVERRRQVAVDEELSLARPQGAMDRKGCEDGAHNGSDLEEREPLRIE